MRKTCTALLTLVLASTAGAQQLVQTRLLDFKLESCFRANSTTDVGCNVVVTNNGDDPVKATFVVSEYNSASTATYGGQGEGVKARSAMFAGIPFEYTYDGVIAGHTSVRTQVNFDIPKAVKSLDTVVFSGIKFVDVPLAKDLPDEPFVNAAGPLVNSFDGETFKSVMLGCQRAQGVQHVDCYFTTRNTKDDTYCFLESVVL